MVLTSVWYSLAADRAKEPPHKAISMYLCVCAHFLRNERERAEEEVKQLKNYLKKSRYVQANGTHASWSFSPLVPTLSKRLNEKDRKKVFGLISLMEGKALSE